MTEAEFEREATQLFRDLGLSLDQGALNFFESDDHGLGLSAESDWKSGLKKPSQPRVRRRTAPSRPVKNKENITRPLNGTNNSYKKQQEPIVLAPPSRSPSSRRKYQVRTAGTQEQERGIRRTSAVEKRYIHPEMSHVSATSTTGSGRSGLPVATRRSSSPAPYAYHETTNRSARTYVQQPTAKVHHRSSSGSGTVLNSSLQTPPKGGSTTTTDGFFKREDTQSKYVKTAPNGERKTPSTSSTQVIYNRKPTLKIISMTTSSSSRVHTVKDRSDSIPPSSRLQPTGQDSAGQWRSGALDAPKSSTQVVQKKEPSPPSFADYDHLSSPEPTKASSDSSASSQTARSSRNVATRLQQPRYHLQQERDPSSSSSRRRATPDSERSRSATPSGSRSSVERLTSPEVGDIERDPTSPDDMDTSPEPPEIPPLKEGAEKSTLLDVNFRRTSLERPNKYARVNACATTTVRALSNLMEVLTPEKTFKLDVGDSPISPTYNQTQIEPDLEEEDDFYGYCAKCGEPVIGVESGCLALDDVYHLKCFTCSRCSGSLSDQNFYVVQNEVLCETDYLTTLDVCHVCKKKITERVLKALGHSYHPGCFCCTTCEMCLDGVPYTSDSAGRVYCIPDFHKMFAPKCAACQMPIAPQPGKVKSVRVIAMKRSFHVECYKCEDCGKQLASRQEGPSREKCYPLEDHLLCKGCNTARAQGLPTRTTSL